jgi:hypothetical protein
MRTFYSKPPAYHLLIWIGLPILAFAILLIADGMEWDLANLVVMSSFFLMAYLAMMRHYQTYEIVNGTFRIKVFAYFTQFSVDLDKLISVNYRENSRFKQLLGIPQKTIELYFERQGHVELLNTDQELFKLLKKHQKSKQIAANA